MPLPSLLQRFKSGAQARPPAPLSPAEIEQARVKALRRMIGMAVLVSAGVVVFSWLFETQPRPLSHDVQVVSAASPSAVTTSSGLEPSAGAVVPRPLRPLVVAEPTPAPAQADSAGQRASQRMAGPQADADASPEPLAQPAPKADDETAGQPQAQGQPQSIRKTEAAASSAGGATRMAQASSKPGPKPVAAKAASKPVAAKPVVVAKPASKPEAKPVVVADAKPKAPLSQANTKPGAKAESKPPAKPEPAKPVVAANANTRYIVQVGAFSDGTTAHAARMKVERLGIKTYTQVADTPGGKKIRVRIGPYASKAEADKAMTTLRKAGITGALLTL